MRVREKSSFALKEAISTRTLCKSLISPQVGLLPAPPRTLVLTEISRILAISPELAELPSVILSLHRRRLNLQGRFGLFVSALKIPFPRNKDFGSKRPVRMRCR